MEAVSGSRFKYIIYEDDEVSVFDTSKIHAWMKKDKPVRSAGFLIFSGSVKCYGESTTLGKKSAEGDDALVAQHIFEHGLPSDTRHGEDA